MFTLQRVQFKQAKRRSLTEVLEVFYHHTVISKQKRVPGTARARHVSGSKRRAQSQGQRKA